MAWLARHCVTLHRSAWRFVLTGKTLAVWQSLAAHRHCLVLATRLQPRTHCSSHPPLFRARLVCASSCISPSSSFGHSSKDSYSRFSSFLHKSIFPNHKWRTAAHCANSHFKHFDCDSALRHSDCLRNNADAIKGRHPKERIYARRHQSQNSLKS